MLSLEVALRDLSERNTYIQRSGRGKAAKRSHASYRADCGHGNRRARPALQGIHRHSDGELHGLQVPIDALCAEEFGADGRDQSKKRTESAAHHESARGLGATAQ